MQEDESHIDPILKADHLSIGFRRSGKRDLCLLENQDLEIYPGDVVCVLGPNGSGKSTLLRTLSGIQNALAGSVVIAGSSINSKQVRQTARLLSVVLTERIEVRNLTVYQLVSMGRYPYNNWVGRITKTDREIIERSLKQVRLEGFADRYLDELSDGEQQRCMIAKALTQDTPVIMLDEPTAHLDLPNRVAIMQLLQTLAKETGKCIIFSSHELDLALQTANILWLMRKGEPMRIGSPQQLVDAGAFESTFETDDVDAIQLHKMIRRIINFDVKS